MDSDFALGKMVGDSLRNKKFKAETFHIMITDPTAVEFTRYDILDKVGNGYNVAVLTCDDIEYYYIIMKDLKIFLDGLLSKNIIMPQQYFCGDVVTKQDDMYYLVRDDRLRIATFMIGKPEIVDFTFYKPHDFIEDIPHPKETLTILP